MVEGTCGICLGVADLEPELLKDDRAVKEQRDADSRYFNAQATDWCRICKQPINIGDTIRRTWSYEGTPANPAYIHEECP